MRATMSPYRPAILRTGMYSAKMPQPQPRLPRPMFPYSDNLQRSGQVAHLGFIPLQFSVAPWANVHRLISSVFLHSDVFHVAGNCLFLWVFGRSLQRLFGTTVF